MFVGNDIRHRGGSHRANSGGFCCKSGLATIRVSSQQTWSAYGEPVIPPGSGIHRNVAVPNMGSNKRNMKRYV